MIREVLNEIKYLCTIDLFKSRLKYKNKQKKHIVMTSSIDTNLITAVVININLKITNGNRGVSRIHLLILDV